VGLDIGAETTEEIAVSIIGEVVASRNRRAGGPLSEESSVPANVSVKRIARPALASTARSAPASDPTGS
jgi:hypothetical protein